MNEILVEELIENIRLDKYLTEKIGLSRSKVQKLIDEDSIVVNDSKVKSSYKVKNDDIIKILSLAAFDEKEVVAENILLDIVYEDDELLIVNKPSGMVVHPAAGNYSHTLVNALLYHFNTLSNKTSLRPGIVHRIDKDTSGLLIVCKTDEAHESLSRQIKEHTVTREYVALVWGVILNNTGTIDAPIGRDNSDRKKMAVTELNSKPSITHFTVLERLKNTTLVKCRLETGRTHQIRAHFKYINHPLVNDYVYSNRNVISREFGQMLHAKKIGFVHPKTGEYMEFEKEAPSEFLNIIKLAREEEL